MNATRVEAEKVLAVKQAEVAEMTRKITETTWETSSKAKELQQLQVALEIIER